MFCGPGRDFRESRCVADEHYIPTLLATYREDESRSQATPPLTYTSFSPGETHPRTFYPGETASAIRTMKCRHWAGCAPPTRHAWHVRARADSTAPYGCASKFAPACSVHGVTVNNLINPGLVGSSPRNPRKQYEQHVLC